MPIVAFGGDLTPNDIIALAIKDAGVYGVGQTPKAEDTNDALLRLNMMLSQWNRKRWLVYRLVTTSYASTGAQSYSVGPQQQFDVPRPDRLESAFVRQTNLGINTQPDYPLVILEAREDYNLIKLKSLQAFAQYVFYDPSYPIGTVYFWPIPSNEYSLFITTKAVISQFSNLAETINLPPEYHAALHYNLVVRLCAGYQMPIDPDVKGLAQDALETIRGANLQIGKLQMPDALVSRGQYDVFSDRS